LISLVWPFWQRQAVADRSCALLAQHYAGLDLELIVVDDGNAEPYRAPAMPFPVRVIRLPVKSMPLNPCVPLNRGVAEARGDIIALSGPDMMHTKPVLAQMRDELGDDQKKYVLAAVWYADRKVWHCHSSYKRSDAGDVGSMLPPGADYHFMTMMHRSLWDAAGGFDEDYRQGCGYDDPDFVLRLNRAGAKFLIRDDLVVEHVRQGARAAWSAAGYVRNREIFMRKWR
jgi:glycosyltransferase involved in cell wall biosynthesis